MGAVLLALSSEDLRGPVNVTAPGRDTAESFARTLARVLNRPFVVSVPSTAAKLVFGEMADGLLAMDARVEPEILRGAGYRFRFRELEDALRHQLGRQLG
jgi:hypothetical protein